MTEKTGFTEADVRDMLRGILFRVYPEHDVLEVDHLVELVLVEHRADQAYRSAVETDANCERCGGGITWIDSPTGGWWAHHVHPADDHDAVYPSVIEEETRVITDVGDIRYVSADSEPYGIHNTVRTEADGTPYLQTDEVEPSWNRCPDCDGKGRVIDRDGDEVRCEMCQGLGAVE